MSVRPRLATLALAALLAGPLASAVHAAAPDGACCAPNGSCTETTVFQCEDVGGTYIGDDTSCLMIECERPLAAPALSIFGAVAAVGALAALGVRRLMVGRRKG
jgi:hypothetical protein